eukprot:629877-Alexandrium_andersonii.AAC.1
MQRQQCNAGPPAGYIQLPPLTTKEDLDATPWTSIHGPARPAPEERYREDLGPRTADHTAALALYSAYRTGAVGHTGLSWGQRLR